MNEYTHTHQQAPTRIRNARMCERDRDKVRVSQSTSNWSYWINLCAKQRATRGHGNGHGHSVRHSPEPRRRGGCVGAKEINLSSYQAIAQHKDSPHKIYKGQLKQARDATICTQSKAKSSSSRRRRRRRRAWPDLQTTYDYLPFPPLVTSSLLLPCRLGQLLWQTLRRRWKCQHARLFYLAVF